MDIITRLVETIETDEEDREDAARRLTWEYTISTPDQRDAIDRAFIALCGWSLHFLLTGAEAPYPPPAGSPWHDFHEHFHERA